MNRFDFIKRIFLSGAAALVAKHAGAGVPERTTEIYLNSPYIAGFKYYNGSELEKHLKKNDELTLQRQPENPHDYFAVEVFRKNQKLGYLPRTDNKIVARMMDQGVKVKARIRSIDPEAQPFKRVKIRVYSEIKTGKM
ncbi:HIRAN protein [Mariniphaga sediminis]|uniref:HIRAN protein n=1 Tax=Mariniphaga sediminis TaxID=1628158 RepID=A0A399D6I0_9BACT|nr:HIRAN domain-containing protein [Mariniphaga sediminis]RIH67157.1 HIRAN protein [Mariniphaga sediminis]